MLKRLLRAFRSGGTHHPGGRPPAAADPTFTERKRRKLSRIRPLLDEDRPCRPGELFYDFLTDEVRQQYNITHTPNVSSHDYDGHALQLIQELNEGLILDCGAGLRPIYFDNVINFEVCPYETTDVRGVGEQLPFRTGVFDAVFSFSVLEHVQDPFACAREIVRVMKPGANLYCVAPFLAPFHAYPHHYYNMSRQGLRNLFEPHLHVEKQEVNTGGLPIFMLTWILNRWADGLPARTRSRFLNMRVADLIGSPLEYLGRPFVAELSDERNFELAATTSLFARKPAA